MPVLRAPVAPVLTETVAALAAGRLAVLVDQQRDAGDLVGVAEHASAEGINFMAREGCGLVCLALSPAQVARLELRPMAAVWDQPCKPFTVSVDAREGITTGISAAERAHTIRVAVAAGTRPEDLVVPGHVFPLRGNPAGFGRTEAALAVAGLAGGMGAVICEILDEAGELASAAGARHLARRHGLPAIEVGALRAVVRGVPGDQGGRAPRGLLPGQHQASSAAR